MSRIIIFLIGCSVLLLNHVAAQPSMQWQKSLGFSTDDRLMHVECTPDGGYITGGYTDNTMVGGLGEYWLVKTDSLGNMQWQSYYGASSSELLHALQPTYDNGYILAGYSSSTSGMVSGNHGNHDYWIVKTDSVGALQWQRSYGGSINDLAYDIKQTPDSGYIIAGATQSQDGDVSFLHSYPYHDYWIVKIDALGNIQWEKTFGGSNSDFAHSIAMTSDGGYVIAGETISQDGDVTGFHGGIDFWVVKIDSAGNLQWQKALGGTAAEYARSIEQTTDGGYIVSGISRSNDGDVTGNHGGYDYWVVKLDAAANIQWKRSCGGSLDEGGQSVFRTLFEDNTVKQTSDGGYVVSGHSTSNDGDVSGHHNSSSFTDYWVFKLDGAGNFIWQKSLGGEYMDHANDIKITQDGGFIITGSSASVYGDVTNNHGNFDGWLVKLTCLPPSAAFSVAPGSYCVKDTLFITNSTAYYDSVAWFDNNAFVSSALAPQLVLSTPGNHSITLVAYSGSCNGPNLFQSDTMIISVTAAPLPSVSLSGLLSSYCIDNGAVPISLSPAGGALTGNGISGNNYDPLLAGAGTDTVIYSYTDVNGCANADTSIVNVFNLPVVSFSGLQSAYCQDASPVSLTASPAGGSFSGNGVSGNSFIPSSAGAGTFSISYVYTDTNGCSATTSQQVTVNQLPNVTMSAFPSLCSNDTLLILSYGTPPGGSYSGVAVGGNSFDPAASGAGTFNIDYIYTDNNGCADTASQSITVNAAPPVPVITPASASLCPGDTVVLTSSSAAGNQWSDGITTSQALTATSAGYYYVTVTNVNGCSSSSAGVNVTALPSPAVSITGSDSVCYGDHVSLAASGVGSFQWSTGEPASAIDVSPLVNTYYTVTATNSCGTAGDTIGIAIMPLPNVSAGNDTAVILGTGLQLSAFGSAGTYEWLPSAGLSCTSCESPFASPSTTTSYIVTITGANGCMSSDTVTVFVDDENTLYIPNIFSANNDGANDILFVRGKGIKEIHFIIYERWGEKVFESRDLSAGWDGSFQGKPMDPGVFVYYVEAVFFSGNKIEQKGDVTLVR